MGEVAFEHSEMASGRWAEMPFHLQMGNIGSEVSRTLRWLAKSPKRAEKPFDRALELFDLSILSAQKEKSDTKLAELCRAREEFCDYYFGNSFGTDPRAMQKYYDQFAMMGA